MYNKMLWKPSNKYTHIMSFVTFGYLMQPKSFAESSYRSFLQLYFAESSSRLYLYGYFSSINVHFERFYSIPYSGSLSEDWEWNWYFSIVLQIRCIKLAYIDSTCVIS